MAVEGKSELSEKALLLTFDDGYIDNYTFAFPILEEFGIQGEYPKVCVNLQTDVR